jgi:hypothetical protein
VPHASLEMPDLVSLGAEFLRWEVATATAGLLLDINPFGEPNVQQAKDATRGLLDRYQQQHQLPFPEPHGSSNGARLTLTEPAVEALGGSSADTFLRVAKAGDYVALLAYLPSDDPQWENALQTFRQAIATIYNRSIVLDDRGCSCDCQSETSISSRESRSSLSKPCRDRPRNDYRATRATIAVTLSVAPLFIADRTTFCATSSTAF